MGVLELMAAPFAECMVLVGIHTYLGIHVLRRRVIFVDLALAQIAALGTMLGFLFGIMPGTSAALIVSMAFTFVGAGVFALTRVRGGRIPHEAVIGLVYAITAAIAVLVVEKTRGGEHLKEILVGCILWVKWSDVAAAGIAYTLVGIVHFVFRRQFFLISEDPDKARAQGLNVRVWDFFFYVTFGFVIAFSVRVAGVLLVFVFLVAPAIMAFMITDRLRYQLLIGWGMGIVVTIAGLFLSYVVDLPSGPTVVAFYGVALILGAVIFYVARAPQKLNAAARVGVGIVGTAAVAALFYLGATLLAGTSLAVNPERAGSAQAHHSEREHAVTAGAAANPLSAGEKPCEKLYLSLPDADARLELIRKLSKYCKRGGLKLLVSFLSDPATPMFYRSEGHDLLKQTVGQDFGYDPDQDPRGNAAAIKRMQQHLNKLLITPLVAPKPPDPKLGCVQEC
jgi:zinc/manganese transport system permease protein